MTSSHGVEEKKLEWSKITQYVKIINNKQEKVMGKATETFIDKQWKEESDARTLAEGEAIRKDRIRLNGATRGAKRIVKEKRDELKGLEKVAKKGTRRGK